MSAKLQTKKSWRTRRFKRKTSPAPTDQRLYTSIFARGSSKKKARSFDKSTDGRAKIFSGQRACEERRSKKNGPQSEEKTQNLRVRLEDLHIGDSRLGITAGAMSFKENIYDGHTLEAVRKQVRELTGELPAAMIAEEGYRGRRRIGKTEISIPGVEQNAAVYRKRKLKKRFRKRAGIEAIISHLKLDHRMAKNYLKGVAGDEINVRLAGAAFKLMKRIRLYALFFVQFLLIASFQTDSTKRSNRLEQSLLFA